MESFPFYIYKKYTLLWEYDGSIRMGENLSPEEASDDEKNKEIAVLEKSGMILFFPLHFAGNVSPYRVIKSREILGSKEIIVLPKGHEVVVFNPKQKAAYFFSRLENEYGREKQIKRGLLRKVADVENLNSLLPKK